MKYEICNMKYKNRKSGVPCSMLPISYGGGFTIIETLIAIAILALALTGPMALAERGLVAARAAGQEVVAFYLAQEAFEFIKNVRDGNVLTGGSGESWLKGLNKCMEGGGCGIDATAEKQEEQIVSCDGDNADCVLSKHLGTPVVYEHLKGLYGYPQKRGKGKESGDWEKTMFRRKVFISELNDTEVQMSVSVSWNPGAGGERTITIGGNMLNWYNP